MRVAEVGRSVGNAVLKRVGRVAGRFQENRLLSADVLESEGEYLVVFDAPGANPSDVQVRFLGGEVHARVDRFREYREGMEMVFPGRGLALDGRADLPEGAAVDASAARARLDDDGTLSVFLPKTEGDQGTPIAVADEPVADAAEPTVEADDEPTADEPSPATEPDAEDG